MNTPTVGSGWANLLGVLPTYKGGHLEWKEGGKHFVAKIKTIEVQDAILTINLKLTAQRVDNGWEWVNWDKQEIPTKRWWVDMSQEENDATPDKTMVRFHIKGVRLDFILHHPEHDPYPTSQEKVLD